MRDAVLRVRVDGSAQPAIEWRLREIEGVIAPRFAPFVAWHPAKDLPRDGEVGGGTIDCILPMPFARSCVVTLDRRPELYRIESIAFADGVRVEPRARDRSERDGGAAFAAARADIAARASLRPTAQSVVRARSPASPSLPLELSASPLAAGARIERSVEGDRGGVVRRVAIRIDPMRARAAVRELWVDQMEMMFRFLEVETTAGKTVLLPVPFARIRRNEIEVNSIFAHHFANVPTTKHPDQITLLEEEKITAYFGAGTFYAEPSRSEPLI
jgi:hypothetical protein